MKLIGAQTKLIGIAGKAGTGKNEVARILEEKGYAIIAFADVLKRILKDVFDFSDEQMWGPSQNRNAVDTRFSSTPRHFLQSLGMWGRDCYTDVWVEYTMRAADAILNPEEYAKKNDDKKLDSFAPVYKYSDKKGLYLGGYKHKGSGITPHVGVVISDVRFMNEADAIRKRDGKIFLVKRQTSLSGVAAMHESENGLPYDDSFYDSVIDNSGDLQQLKTIVSRMI